MSSFKKVSIALVALGLTVPVVAGCESSFAKASSYVEASADKSEDRPVVQSKTIVSKVELTEVADAPEAGELVPSKFEEIKPEAVKPKGEFDALDELANYEPVIEEVEGIQMTRLITSAGIVDREPSVEASIFPVEEEKIYAFMELANTTDEIIELDVVFTGPKGESTGYVTVEVPANTPRWRTWAYTRYANTVGQWKVEVRLKDGTLLGKLAFDVDVCC